MWQQGLHPRGTKPLRLSRPEYPGPLMLRVWACLYVHTCAMWTGVCGDPSVCPRAMPKHVGWVVTAAQPPGCHLVQDSSPVSTSWPPKSPPGRWPQTLPGT